MASRMRVELVEPGSILIVLPTWVGDFVMATPFLRAVRARYPDARITYLLEPNLLDLALGCPWVDECVAWPIKARRMPWHRELRQVAKILRGQQLDWAVLLPNSARAALIAFMAKAKQRIGYDRDGRGLLLTHRVAVKNRKDGQFVPLPLVEYYADLAEVIGCPGLGDRLELHTTSECDESVEARLRSLKIADHSPLIVLSPGAKYGAAKCWFPERFAETADRLIREQNASVIVTCGPGEQKIAGSIRAAMKEQAFVFDDPLLSLGELKSLIKRSALLICNDAGPRHFAKAFDVPVVTIFGPTDPQWTATSYQDERIVRVDIECGPCQKRVCPLGHVDCMKRVGVDMVYDAAVELLNSMPSTDVSINSDGSVRT